ncbi:glycosyltransferase [Weissella diestrammenae]|uniref:glycosyltransferase n=1 Tax=Weissella diestrammenae TaxID=1162633 RepID=UPI00202F8D4E|nr:glycosyltransferase [Weissella diestrammenae]
MDNLISPLYVTAVIPAHNEAEGIQATVLALKKQVDEVIVICDNCTDNTQELAQAAGARAYVTVNNTARKAGALNQCLASICRLVNAKSFLIYL